MQRRREPRYRVSESIVLSMIEGREAKYSAAMLVDISRTGCRIVSALELAVGAEVLFTLNSVAVAGRVRYCESAADSFAAGVEITNIAGGVAARADLISGCDSW